MKILLFILCLSTLPSFAKEKIPVDDIPQFGKIKGILQNDQLLDSAENKVSVAKKEKAKVLTEAKSKYNYPKPEDFWGIMSEYWLVKNAPLLKWDFEKPDYGLDDAFKILLQTLGMFEVGFKILLVDTPQLTHTVLPSSGDYIFLVSNPFIKAMDLSKLEISLLLLEDLFRAQNGYFTTFLMDKDLQSTLGSNFYQKKFNATLMQDTLKKYDHFIFKKGHSFQQQFDVTQKMNNMLKAHLKIWLAYEGLLQKIDQLVKTNALFKNYLEIYPSPEIQLKWLRPKERTL